MNTLTRLDLDAFKLSLIDTDRTPEETALLFNGMAQMFMPDSTVDVKAIRLVEHRPVERGDTYADWVSRGAVVRFTEYVKTDQNHVVIHMPARWPWQHKD